MRTIARPLKRNSVHCKFFDSSSRRNRRTHKPPYASSKDRVDTYRNEVNNLKTAKSEEEASRHVTTLCERMKGVLKSVAVSG